MIRAIVAWFESHPAKRYGAAINDERYSIFFHENDAYRLVTGPNGLEWIKVPEGKLPTPQKGTIILIHSLTENNGRPKAKFWALADKADAVKVYRLQIVYPNRPYRIDTLWQGSDLTDPGLRYYWHPTYDQHVLPPDGQNATKWWEYWGETVWVQCPCPFS